MYEKTISSKRIFEGRVVKLDLLQVELENGVLSEREVIRHAGAATVIPRLPDGRFVLIKQFRKPLDREFIEFVAGTLEEGEESIECARRELTEETGYTAIDLVFLGTTYPSPGYVDERIDLFLAECGEAKQALEMDFDENIEVFLASAEEIDRMIVEGEIQDAKTLAAWLLYEKRRTDKI